MSLKYPLLKMIAYLRCQTNDYSSVSLVIVRKIIVSYGIFPLSFTLSISIFFIDFYTAHQFFHDCSSLQHLNIPNAEICACKFNLQKVLFLVDFHSTKIISPKKNFAKPNLILRKMSLGSERHNFFSASHFELMHPACNLINFY